jgi:hypothetical protein
MNDLPVVATKSSYHIHSTSSMGEEGERGGGGSEQARVQVLWIWNVQFSGEMYLPLYT